MAKKVNLKKKLKRKRKTEIAEGKKQRTVKIIVGLITAFLMASSILMFAGNKPSSPYVFNKHHFEHKNNLWVTKINGQEKTFYYFPSMLTSINCTPLAKDRVLNSKYVLITFDPVNDSQYMLQAMDAVRFSLFNALSSQNVQVGMGIVHESPFYNLTVINCSESSQYIPVVELRKGNETRIFMNDSCIILEATTPAEMLAVGDRFLYSIYGVMN